MDTKSGNCGESCENSDNVGQLMTSSSTTSENPSGCGENDLDKITITVAPTTGGTFDISVQKNIAIENLKKVISKKLKVPKERILLLHKERQLRDGSLIQNSIADGSTLTLLPSVETGLLSQRPEQTVMQALESLNDTQVNDFLSGKAPLNLTMRLGDHMMLIQLQLSSVTPSSRKSSHRAAEAAPATVPTTDTTSTTTPPATATSPSASDISLPNLSLINSKLNSLLHKNSENLNALKRKLIPDPDAGKKKIKPELEKDCPTTPEPEPEPEPEAGPSTPKKSAKYSDIIKDTVGGQEAGNKRSEILSQIMESVRRISQNTQEMTQAIIESKVCEGGGTPRCESSCSCGRKEGTTETPNTESPAALDTKALAEASRNLTQTLKQLSSEVLTCRPETSDETATPGPSSSRRRPGTPGAIIESMQHHGKGVFSGTFSGTLNPALQDRFGRPKRDISTIIHILNDLLCATPHYRQRQSSSSSSKSASTSTSTQATPSAKASQDIGTGEVEMVDVAVENEATRGKLERLRMVMEQNRARRRARREGKPSWITSEGDLENVDDIDGAVDTSDMLEISPPEPVVA